MGASGWTHLDIDEIPMERPKALCVRIKGERENRWIPKSVIADAENYDEGDENVQISVKDWFCEKENIRGT